MEHVLGCDKLCMLRDVARNKSLLHPSIVEQTPKELLPNDIVVVARDDEEENQGCGVGSVTTPVQDLVTSLTKMPSGAIFDTVAVTRVSDAGMMTGR